MQADLPVRIEIGNDPLLNGQFGLLLHRVVGPESTLSRNRYLVRLESDESTVAVDLENLVCTDEEFYDDCKGEDDDGDIIFAAGLTFCMKHRLEICGSCGYNFRISNLMRELPCDSDVNGVAEQIEEAMHRDLSPIRKAPRFGEKYPSTTQGAFASGTLTGLEGGLIPSELDPCSFPKESGSSAKASFRLRHEQVQHTSPAIKNAVTTIEGIAAWAEHDPSTPPIQICLQNEEQTDVMWIRIISYHPLPHVGPLLVLRWVCGNASNPLGLFAYIEQGSGYQVVEIKTSSLEILAMKSLLTENGGRLQRDYVSRTRAMFRPHGWNISAVVPIRGSGGNALPCYDKCGTQQAAVLKKCSRCKSAKYCGRDCQSAAWKQHKKSCVPVSV
jgi:hypothetical protein